MHLALLQHLVALLGFAPTEVTLDDFYSYSVNVFLLELLTSTLLNETVGLYKAKNGIRPYPSADLHPYLQDLIERHKIWHIMTYKRKTTRGSLSIEPRKFHQIQEF